MATQNISDDTDKADAERGRILGEKNPITLGSNGVPSRCLTKSSGDLGLNHLIKWSKQHKFFDAKLQAANYITGDIFDDITTKKYQDQWDITKCRSSRSQKNKHLYLKQIKELSKRWPHLRLLADFMEISTDPPRWPKLCTNVDDRVERWRRVKVARLDYSTDGSMPRKTEYLDTTSLHCGLKDDDLTSGMRIYIVEDLSRNVIEALGCRYRVEPEFWREHIMDYAWFNVRDRWANPPKFSSVRMRQRWIQIRYVTARYFKDEDAFQEGRKQAEQFNVLRRPDDDQNNAGTHWDAPNTIVGLTRSRSSFWLQQAEAGKAAIGILLIDPTIKTGTPLWYGYRNWEETPLPEDVDSTVEDDACSQEQVDLAAQPHNDKGSPQNGSDAHPVLDNGAPRTSLFDDVVYWAQRPAAFSSSPSHLGTSSDLSNTIPMQALLHLVCSDWLTITEYIRTRLTQIDWEIAFPEEFLPSKKVGVDPPLKKLHVWRRLVPLYREMLEEMFKRLSDLSPHKDYLQSLMRKNTADMGAQDPPSSLPPILNDFAQALTTMREHQTRIERLTTIVTATISIIDTRREQENNKNISRLTWLATFFVPLGYIASLFSIQPDIGQLIDSFRIYFSAALPISFFIMVIAFISTHSRIQSLVKNTLGNRKRTGLRVQNNKWKEQSEVRLAESPPDRGRTFGWLFQGPSKKGEDDSSAGADSREDTSHATEKNGIRGREEV